jgi:hypothetical protein
MKAMILINIFLLLSSIYVFGQDVKPAVLQHYEYKEKMKPFLLRWYGTMRGESSYAWKETLLLKTDSSFVYKYEGGNCGTFNHTGAGTWTMKKNELILIPIDGCFMPDKSFIMNKGVLYRKSESTNRQVAAFKMKRPNAHSLQ